MNEAQPFAGITVIEFGQFIAVPYAAQLLADGGATVIKVEPPDGDPSRTTAPLIPGESRLFILRNRGKRSLRMRLDSPRSKRVLDALMARADVVLTNMRPGLAAKLGLDFETLSEKYPRIIVADVTAFGRNGPDAELAGMDLVIQARSGLTASNGRMKDGLPATSDSPIADYMCAGLVAFGVASALLRRERTGRGGKIDVALLMAGLVLQNNLLIRIEEVDGPLQDAGLERLAEARAAGKTHLEQLEVIPSGRSSVGLTAVYYRSYATKDSIVAIACISRPLQKRLMMATGMIPADGSQDAPASSPELQRQMEELFASKTTAEWKVILDAGGVPASRVYFPVELLRDAQTEANGMFHDFEHHAFGKTRVLSAPLSLDGGGFVPGPPAGPFGSESRAILEESGLSQEEIEALFAEGVVGGPM